MPYCPLCGHALAAGTYACRHCRRNVPLDAKGQPALLDTPPPPPAPPADVLVTGDDGVARKKCPFCAELIQPDARVCRFCQRDLVTMQPPATAMPAVAASQSSSGKLVLGCLGTLLLLWLIGAFLGPSTRSDQRPTPAAAYRSSSPVLALLSVNGEETETGSYVTVEGQVKNLSDSSLQNVEAVATWMASDGSFITSDSALIDYNPLLPGQTSPFQVITRANPAMKRYTVAFKRLMGGTLPAVDQSGKGALTK